MIARTFAALVLLLAATPALAADLPDPDLTPGALRDGVTADDLCPVAHTGKIRHVTAAQKRQAYQAYGIKTHRPGDFEIDHLCSLELGGSNDSLNLWPQSYRTTPWNAHVKDKLENEMHRRVCTGELTPQQACAALSTDWIKAYRQYLGEP